MASAVLCVHSRREQLHPLDLCAGTRITPELRNSLPNALPTRGHRRTVKTTLPSKPSPALPCSPQASSKPSERMRARMGSTTVSTDRKFCCKALIVGAGSCTLISASVST
eukprot:3080179-Rhodomonas_salina.1